MASGYWTRYGRGSCVGYSLTIGYGPFSFRAGVTRNVLTFDCREYTRRAEIFDRTIAHDLPDRDTALEKVEAELRDGMRHVLDHWRLFEQQGRSSVKDLGRKRR